MFNNSFSEEIWASTYKADREEKIQDSWKRAAKTAASVEKEEIRTEWEHNFYTLFENFSFVPGGRILSNIGTDKQGVTLYNCFVSAVQDLDIQDPDSIEGIYKMLTKQAQTLKSEGGYGVNCSWIRPEGSYIKGIGARTPGALKFMELWDKSSEIITAGSVKTASVKQDGEKNKIRKGAQMLVMEVWHPEIKEFIIAKQTPNRLTKFNVSVGITNGFMQAVEGDLDWQLKFPDTTCPKYKTEWKGNIEVWEAAGNPVIVYETVRAQELWELIMKSTYNRNEPGVLFIDLCNKLNPLSYAENIRATNPCGELPMATGVCCLGSLNLTQFVKNQFFDFDKFSAYVAYGVRFLDNIQDISKTPLQEYSDSVKNKRRIGLGVMGLGSIHFMLGIKYGSQESLNLIEKISRVKCETELLTSAKLGQEKGSFKLFDKRNYFNTHYWKNLCISDEVKKQVEDIGYMRNSHQSMNAPTGNTGILANNVSGGIEPVFMKEYLRWSIVNEKDQAILLEKGLKYPNIQKGQWFETDNFKFANRGNEQILRGSFDGVDYEIDKNRGLVKSTLIEDFGWQYVKKNDEIWQKREASGVFATTVDLPVENHVEVLGLIAKYTNQACSKTINIPNKYPYEDFKNIYLSAWKKGIKGLTTYREGTMSVVLESADKKDEKSGGINKTKAPKRPTTLNADLHHFTIDKQRYYAAIGLLEQDVYEVFTGVNHTNEGDIYIPKDIKHGSIVKHKKGHYIFKSDKEQYDLQGHTDNTADALARVVSCGLRHGASILFLTEQLEKTKGPMTSFAKVLARTLKKYIPNGTECKENCPKCESKLIRDSGCKMCKNCGYSVCG